MMSFVLLKSVIVVARLVDVLERIQREGGLAMRVGRRDDGDAILMTMRRKRVSQQDTKEVARLLRIAPGAPVYRVTYGAVARSNREIAIQTRLIFEIMIELSARAQPYLGVDPESKKSLDAPLTGQ
jgi:hypothetical protein